MGNKVDLDEERKIPREVASAYAHDNMASCRYLETSAKYNVNVTQLFSELLMKTFYGDEQRQVAEAAAAANARRTTARRLSRRLSTLSLRRKSNTSCTAAAATPAAATKDKAEASKSEMEYRRCVIL